MNPDSYKILSCICSTNGELKKIVKNDFNFDESAILGKNLISLVDNTSRYQFLDFFYHLKDAGFAMDSTIKLPEINQVKLFFIGILQDGVILLLITNKAIQSADILDSFDFLTSSQKEVLKRNFNTVPEAVSIEHLNELTKLNNELINLQRTLQKQNNELKKLDQIKNQFLGMAAHDLRNPLALISNFAQLALRNIKKGKVSEVEYFFQIIRDKSVYMEHLINDLLDVTAIESGEFKLNKTDENINSIIGLAIHQNSLVAAEKNISIQLYRSEDELMVSVDKIKIEQVLNNLIQNAVKFSFKNSKIGIFTASDEQEVTIGVKDAGTGIEKEKIDEIFEPFNKFHTKGTSGEKGTGLGLAISKKIIDAHNGSLWLESEPGKGSTFYFSLPV